MLIDKLLCSVCKNYLGNLSCIAFEKIPQEILVGENDHSEPLPEQENNIIFEPINEQEQ
jgi:hypothetical protein